MGYLICDSCNSYYELQSGESPYDFNLTCDCGGKLIYSDELVSSNTPNNASKSNVNLFYFKSIYWPVALGIGIIFGLIYSYLTMLVLVIPALLIIPAFIGFLVPEKNAAKNTAALTNALTLFIATFILGGYNWIGALVISLPLALLGAVVGICFGWIGWQIKSLAIKQSSTSNT